MQASHSAPGPLCTPETSLQMAPSFCWPCPLLPLHELAALLADAVLHPEHQHIVLHPEHQHITLQAFIALEQHSPVLTTCTPHMQALQRHRQSHLQCAKLGKEGQSDPEDVQCFAQVPSFSLNFSLFPYSSHSIVAVFPQ